MHSAAFVSQSINTEDAINLGTYMTNVPRHFATEVDEAEVTFLHWVIVVVGHWLLLFPFPGWIVLYILFDEVSPFTPFMGTIVSIGSIQPGAYLLADARENPGERLKHWIFYSAFVTVLSVIGLLFTIGIHPMAFIPLLVFTGWIGIGGWGWRRIPESDIELAPRCSSPQVPGPEFSDFPA